MAHHATVIDPRDTTGEHCLDVEYGYLPGAPASWDDPGYGPEYEPHEARNKRGKCVLDTLTPSQLSTLIDRVHQEHVND